VKPELDLKDIEKNAYRVVEKDGLFELLLGLGLVIASLGALTRWFTLITILAAISFGPVLKGLRRRITHPRIGYVKLIEMKPELRLGILVLIVIAVAFLMILASLIFGGTGSRGFLIRWGPAGIGLFVAIPFIVFTRKSKAGRNYIYAALSLLMGLVASVPNYGSKHIPWLIYILGFGGILALSGAFMLVRFLGTHPKLDQEETSDVPG
jgi:hypothetical protein